MPSRSSWEPYPCDNEPLSSMLHMQHLLARAQMCGAAEDRRSSFDDRVAQNRHNDKGSFMGYRPAKVGSPEDACVARLSDVTIYVGKNRTPYVQSVQSLKGSSYFRSILEKRSLDSSSSPPIVVDCEEIVFQNMMTLLRYGSFEALPAMPRSEMFKLKMELERYGIQVPDSQSTMNSGKLSSPSSSHSSSSPRSTASSPRAPETISRQFPLAELPGFPMDLTDPAKLVLVSRLDDDARGRCSCATDGKPSQWALNFHHRHAFCTGCGNPPSTMHPKFFAEMFMVAAYYYSGLDQVNSRKWSVSCDSTCALKFLSSGTSCGCTCSRQTVWAVNAYYSHAFCTECGKCADGSALLCMLLTLRYGAPPKSPKGKRNHSGELAFTREAPSLKPAPSRPTNYAVQRNV